MGQTGARYWVPQLEDGATDYSAALALQGNLGVDFFFFFFFFKQKLLIKSSFSALLFLLK